MRVLFLTLYPESMASPRYRVHQFLPYLREHGVQSVVACPFSERDFVRLRAEASLGSARSYHLHEMRVRTMQILGARRYDVVFLQKAAMSAYVRGFAGLLRLRARRLVFDIDDAVHLEAPHTLPPRWHWAEEPDQAKRLFRSADLILAGNDWLRDEVFASGGRTETFPTVVDTDRFIPGTRHDEGFVVGWIGGPSTSHHLAPLRDVLDELKNAEVRLVGADPAFTGSERAEHRAWSFATEVAELQEFSVGLMPLPRTEWARGKCALKALQYMACGVPCVATPFGAVCDIIEDGVNGLYAETPEEWRDAIERLRDVPYRRLLGAAARRTVEDRYSLKVAAPKMRALLESVAT